MFEPLNNGNKKPLKNTTLKGHLDKVTSSQVDLQKRLNALKLGEYTLIYVATPTREHAYLLDESDKVKDNPLMGGVFVSNSKVKGTDIQSSNIQYYVADKFGEDDLPLVRDVLLDLLGYLKDDSSATVQATANLEEQKFKGRSSKFTTVTYHKLNESLNTGDSTALQLDGGVEDYLYETVPFDEITADEDMSWLKQKDYRILTKRADIEEFIAGLDKTDEIVGFDTETSGLRVNRTKKDTIVGISMSYTDNAGVYFPLKQERFDNVEIPFDEFMSMLKPYIDERSPKRKKLVTHNGKFDWGVLKMYDINLNLTYDTYIRQAIYKVASAKGVSKLKLMASNMLGIDVIELDDAYRPRTRPQLRQVGEAIKQGATVNPITAYKFKAGVDKFTNDLLDYRFMSEEFTAVYGPADADFPRLIHKLMDQQVSKKEQEHFDFLYRMEMNLIPVIAEQEYYGVHVDAKGFNKLNLRAKAKLAKLQAGIDELAGHPVNVKSPKQVQHLLYDEMKVPVKSRYESKASKKARRKDSTATPSYGAGKDVLADLEQYIDGYDDKGDPIPRYPVVKLLQQFSKTEKLVNSFYDKLPKLITDGYIFPHYNTVQVETGRLSSNSPNIQQTEPSSRDYMIPDDDHHYFLDCDYSQAEYRFMSGLAHEQKNVDYFNNNPEADYHSLAFANMMHIPVEDVTPAQRKKGKVLNFGISYGLQDQALALKLYGDDSPINQQRAHQARIDYLDGVPNIRDYFEAVRDRAEETGYTETLFGRRREIMEFHDIKGNLVNAKRLPAFKRESGRRKAGNMPVQGTSADVIKIAMIKLRMLLKKYNLPVDKARLVLNVHDELLLCVDKSINPWFMLAIIRQAMEIDLSNYGVPRMLMSGNVGSCWHDGKRDDLESPSLLQDKMCAWAMDEYHKAGDDYSVLPTYDDPKQYWLETIAEFSLGEVQNELNLGYKINNPDGTFTLNPINNVVDARKDKRLDKYIGDFGIYQDAYITELMEHRDIKGFYHSLWKHRKAVQQWKSPTAKRLLVEIKDLLIKYDCKDVSAVVEHKDLIMLLSYFGDMKKGYAKVTVESLLTNSVDDTLVYIQQLQQAVTWKQNLESNALDIIDSHLENGLSLLSKVSAFNLEDYQKISAGADLKVMLNDEEVSAKPAVAEKISILLKDLADTITSDEAKYKLGSTKLVALPVIQSKETGKLSPDDTETLKRLVDDALKYNESLMTWELTLPEDDTNIYGIVDHLLLSGRELKKHYPSKQGEAVRLQVNLTDGRLYTKGNSRVLPEGMDLLRRIIREYFLDNVKYLGMANNEVTDLLASLVEDKQEEPEG